jgi:transposase-like protein
MIAIMPEEKSMRNPLWQDCCHYLKFNQLGRKDLIVPSYSEKRKQQILNKLLQPSNMTVAEVSRNEGIGVQTLYNWRDKAKQQGRQMPGSKPTSEH